MANKIAKNPSTIEFFLPILFIEAPIIGDVIKYPIWNMLHHMKKSDLSYASMSATSMSASSTDLSIGKNAAKFKYKSWVLHIATKSAQSNFLFPGVCNLSF